MIDPKSTLVIAIFFYCRLLTSANRTGATWQQNGCQVPPDWVPPVSTRR
ncbi:MAG: hypothetical protein ACOYJG_12780 [Prevotella sp.]